MGLGLFLVVWLLSYSSASAENWTDKVEFSGFVQSDIRYNIDDYRGADHEEDYAFQMNRNDVRFKLDIFPTDKVMTVIDTRLRFYGFNEADELSQYSRRNQVDPWSLHLDEAYLMVKGFLWENMDLKIGRMIQNWGTVDQFNPTNNLNAMDLSDPLDYSAKVPNEMLEIDLYPADWISLHFIWIPFFKPAMLPPSAPLAFAVEYEDNGCFKSAPTPPLKSDQVQQLIDLFGSLNACDLNFETPIVNTIRPKMNIQNSQAAAKAQFRVGDLDFSLSYFYGRFQFPIPVTAVADVDSDPDNPSKLNVLYQAEVMYPKMHVAGFDFSYSAPWFFDVGFFGEVAAIFPEEIVFAMRAFQNGTELTDLRLANTVLKTDPFVKASGGFDYAFTQWLYLNVIYVYGFFDEFNEVFGLHHYVSTAVEMKFFENEFQIRLANVISASDRSDALFPQITWIVYPSVELIGGAFFYFGSTKLSDPNDYGSKTYFGQKASGRNVAFLKAKVSW